MNKNYLIAGAFFVLIIIIVVVIMNKNKTQQTADVAISQVVDNNCVPYSQKQYDDALRLLRNKCGAQLLIPIVGIGAYNKCVATGKAALPEIKNC